MGCVKLSPEPIGPDPSYVLVSRTRATGASGSSAIKGRRLAADLKITTYLQVRSG